MTEEEIEKFNEDQELMAAIAMMKSNDVYGNLINSISEDEAEMILDVIKYGSESDIKELTQGLILMFANPEDKKE